MVEVRTMGVLCPNSSSTAANSNLIIVVIQSHDLSFKWEYYIPEYIMGTDSWQKQTPHLVVLHLIGIRTASWDSTIVSESTFGSGQFWHLPRSGQLQEMVVKHLCPPILPVTLTLGLVSPKSIGVIRWSLGNISPILKIIGPCILQLLIGQFSGSRACELDLWSYDPKMNRGHLLVTSNIST